MSWFKIDDGFHCHPKVFAAGTPAVGLYVRCGSWAAQQASEGVIPKRVAKLYGTSRMIKALVDADLWHGPGHDCESCPEVDANSYLIHQYLERNPSRVAIELARDAKTKRQQRWRDGKKKQQANGDVGHGVDADVGASTLRDGDAAPNPTRPNPVSPTEKQEPKTASYAREPDARIGDRPRIPDASQPLADAITAAGMPVGWDLAASDWFLVEALIKRCGIPALVISAKGSWQGARTQPRTARYFLPGWRALSDAPADTPRPPGSTLTAAVGDVVPLGHRTSTTDQRVQQALDVGRRLQAAADAQPRQELP